MAVTIEESKSKKGRTVLIVASVLLAVIVGVVGVCLTDTGGVNPQNEIEYIEITEGQTTEEVAAFLHERGIIKFPNVFRLQAFVGGYDGHFQSGSAYVEKGMSYTDILNMLITPARNTTKVVVPEGCETLELAKTLCDAGLVTWDDFFAALADPSQYNYRFIAELPPRDNTLEGYLYPATYEIPYGMSAHDIVDLMLSTLDAKLHEEDYVRAQEMGLTMDQILTVASLVQRDTVSGCDLNNVAAIYINRSRCNVPLESRGSIQFILGERKPILSIADTKLDSKYNTFLYSGLPIGPVCNPGVDAINAVLNYVGSEDYYYALLANGTQLFAPDYQTFITGLTENEPAIEVDTDVVMNIDDKRGLLGAVIQIQ